MSMLNTEKTKKNARNFLLIKKMPNYSTIIIFDIWNINGFYGKKKKKKSNNNFCYLKKIIIPISNKSNK